MTLNLLHKFFFIHFLGLIAVIILKENLVPLLAESFEKIIKNQKYRMKTISES